MKCMKKVVSLILGLVMMLSLSTAAFAEGGETPEVSVSDYKDTQTVTITKVYKLENAGTTSPAETFTVEQVGDGIVTDGERKGEPAPELGTITGATFEEGAATVDGATANITINLPVYDRVGVYEYTLKETVGDTAGVVYHSGNIKLVVTVMQGEDGKIRVAGVHTENEGGEKSGSITNVYRAAGIATNEEGLRITKTVDGNMGDKDQYFDFTVTLTGEQGKSYSDSYAVVGGSYDKPETVTIGETLNLKLKHGDTITIENLPYGVHYTVSETPVEGYTTSATGEEGTISAAKHEVSFTNTKTGEVDTGIYTDSLPYILILALVAAAAFVFFSRKRFVKD